MSKQTLLDMVQRISEFIDGETVTSISDTTESMQIATIVKETYEYLIQTREIATRDSIVHFDNVVDPKKPNYLKYQDLVFEVFSLKYYDYKTKRYQDVHYVEPEEFLRRSLDIDFERKDITQVLDDSGVLLNIYNNRCPQYYTSFDSVHIVFDAFDSENEHTIQDAKAVSYGRFMPEFKLEDDFIPNMAPQHFSLLLSKAKENAGVELKEYHNPLEADRAKKLLINTNKFAMRQPEEAKIWKNRKHTGRL